MAFIINKKIMYNRIIYHISAKLKVHLSYGILFDILFISINAIPFKLVRKVYQLREGNFIKLIFWNWNPKLKLKSVSVKWGQFYEIYILRLTKLRYVSMHQTMLIRYFFFHIYRFQLCIGINLFQIISAILYHNL